MESPIVALLDADNAQIARSLEEIKRVDESGVMAIVAAWEAWDAFFRKQNATGVPADRGREIARLVPVIASRLFKWALTDLLRARITSVLGYARLEAEAVGLSLLFQEDPAKAEAWLDAHSDDAGLKFFRANQARLKELLKAHNAGLAIAYDRGSAESLHVRSRMIFRAHDIRPREGAATVFHMLDRELREDDPFSFLEEVKFFLLVQPAVLYGFWRAFPEIPQGKGTFPETGAAATFAKQFDEALQKRYPDRF